MGETGPLYSEAGVPMAPLMSILTAAKFASRTLDFQMPGLPLL